MLLSQDCYTPTIQLTDSDRNGILPPLLMHCSSLIIDVHHDLIQLQFIQFASAAAMSRIINSVLQQQPKAGVSLIGHLIEKATELYRQQDVVGPQADGILSTLIALTTSYQGISGALLLYISVSEQDAVQMDSKCWCSHAS